MFDPVLLKELSEGVIHSEDGLITFFNTAAGQVLPHLEQGCPLPAELVLPENCSTGTGCIKTVRGPHTFSAARSGNAQFTLLYPIYNFEGKFTRTQLDGALRHMRMLLSDVMVQLAPFSNPESENYVGGGLIRSYYRLFRLAGNSEFLNRDLEDLPFHPTTIDLAGMCHRLCMEAGSLLAEANVTLRWESSLTSLLVHGDALLLQQMLLELIANSVQAAPDRQVTLCLTRYGGRALMAVGNSGGPDIARRLISAMAESRDQSIPQPGQGAGLGLNVARKIAYLHGGSLMAVSLDKGPCVTVSLPIRPPESRTSVRSPNLITDGGLNPMLTSLCEVLPISSFTLDGLD